MIEKTVSLSEEVVVALSQVRTEFLAVIPNLITSVFILVVGILVAFVLKWLFGTLMRYFFRILPKVFVQRSFSPSSVQVAISASGQIVFFVVLFLTVTTALKRLGLEVVSSWMQNLSNYLPNVIAAGIILLVGWRLKEFLSLAIGRTLGQTSFSYSHLAARVLSWSVFIISSLVALEQVGVDMGLVITVSSVLAGVLSGGIALMFALGAKSIIADILCCYQIQRYLQVGQRVEIDQKVGIVESIGPVFVLMNTENGKLTVPGSRFSEQSTLILNRDEG